HRSGLGVDGVDRREARNRGVLAAIDVEETAVRRDREVPYLRDRDGLDVRERAARIVAGEERDLAGLVPSGIEPRPVLVQRDGIRARRQSAAGGVDGDE